MEGIKLLRRAARELREGRVVAESVVLESAGSVARPAGARMLTFADGTSEGTVGGGAPEYRCQQLAREAIATGAAHVVRLDRGSTGMVCGGYQLVGIRRLGPADLAVLDELLATVEAGGSGRLVVRWDVAGAGAGAGAGANAGDGGASAFEADPVGAAPAPDAPSYEGGVYVEPVRAAERAIVFGGGHVGRALVPALAAIDLEVVLADNRPEVAVAAAFPQASEVVLVDYGDVLASVDVRPSDYVCVMTHGHAGDEDVIGQVIARHPRYLGCMGSRRKRAVLEQVLGGRGVSAEELARVELPIGLEIGAVTPAEIAVSIAARIVEVRHQGTSQPRTCPA